MPFVNINGTEIYYEEKGKNNKRTILFIHPPVFPGEVFRPQMEGLADKYHVICLDLRGHGKSACGSLPWNFSSMAEDIHQFLDTLNIEKIWLCGYSAGGSIAFQFAAVYPERTEGLIQIGPVDKVDDLMLRSIVKGAREMAKLSILFLAFFGSIINTWDCDKFKQLFKRSRNSSGACASSFYQSYLTYKYTEKLPFIDKPVILVYGSRDRLCGRYAKKINDLLPDSRLAKISNVGHEIPSRKEAELNSIIRSFLN